MKYCFCLCVYSFGKFFEVCMSGPRFGLMSLPSNISVLRSTMWVVLCVY